MHTLETSTKHAATFMNSLKVLRNCAHFRHSMLMVNDYYSKIFTGATIVPFESFNYIYFLFWLWIRYDTVA